MLDIDHFKHFNDTHGHQAGDSLLKHFSEFIRQQIRGEDIACRYGGEEFLLMLPGADTEQSHQRAEQLRIGIGNIKVQFQDQLLSGITCSFGVAAYPDHGEDWETLIHLADAALYRAKRAGRNRVVVADQEVAENRAGEAGGRSG